MKKKDTNELLSSEKENMEEQVGRRHRLKMPIKPIRDTPLFKDVDSMVEKYNKKYHRELDRKIDGEKGIVGTRKNFKKVNDIVIPESYAYISHTLDDLLLCLINLLEMLEEDTKLYKHQKDKIDQMNKQYKYLESYIYNYLYPLGLAYVNLDNKETLKEYSKLLFQVQLTFLPEWDKVYSDYIVTTNNIKQFATNKKEIEIYIKDIEKYKNKVIPRLRKIIPSLTTIFQIILSDEKEIKNMRKMFK